jgi:hypothetical protein
MTLTLTDVVWSEQRYEAGRYDCDVIRAGDHGRLSVHLVTDYDLILVHCELVECDRADTDKWRARCLQVITHPDLRTLAP